MLMLKFIFIYFFKLIHYFRSTLGMHYSKLCPIQKFKEFIFLSKNNSILQNELLLLVYYFNPFFSLMKADA